MIYLLVYFIISVILISIGVWSVSYYETQAHKGVYVSAKIRAWGYAVLVFGIINAGLSFILLISNIICA